LVRPCHHICPIAAHFRRRFGGSRRPAGDVCAAASPPEQKLGIPRKIHAKVIVGSTLEEVKMPRVPRWVPTIFAGLFATIFLLPLISSHVRQWAETHGHTLLLNAATRVMSGLGDASQATAFVFITGFFIGAALLLWIDYALRRRTYGGGAQDMGLILAGIGLTTFVIGLGIYFFPPPTPVQSATKTPSPAPPPSLEKEDLAWSKTPILGWSKQPDGVIYARTFGVVGTNIGAEEIQLDDIYIVSGITGARIDLKVQVANDGLFAAKDTNPIPPDAYIQLSSDELGPSGGIPERDFLTDWATIDFVAEYGGRQHRTTFDRATIIAMFETRRPQFEPPHVSRKFAPAPQAALSSPPQASAPTLAPSAPPADAAWRKRDLLQGFAEELDGPVMAAAQQGRKICDDWNALGGLTTRQLSDEVTGFGKATIAAFTQLGELQRKAQLDDPSLATGWAFDDIMEKTAKLLNDLTPVFFLDDKSARQTILDKGSFVAWAASIRDFDRWIGTKRQLIADKMKESEMVQGDARGAQ